MQLTKEDFCRQVLDAEPSLYRVSRSILHNDEDCADAIQEGILKAWRNLHTLKNEQYFRTWLTRIVINECYQIIRKRKREALSYSRLSPGEPTPEPDMEGGAVFQALHRLDEKYRLPIVLQAIEGYSSREIGKMLGLNDATVRTRLHRGKAILQQHLRGDCNHD